MPAFTKVCHDVYYLPNFLHDPDGTLRDIEAQVEFVQRSRKLYGRTFKTPREEAWFGPRPYTFGGGTFPARPLPTVVQAIAIAAAMTITIETLSNGWHVHPNFDSCLVNRYRDGLDSVAWHADDEPEMGDPLIASVSLGAPRDFLLRRKPTRRAAAKAARLAGAPWAEGDNFRVTLGHGSLLVMLPGVQAEFEHSVPKRRGCLDPRVNLTFRQPTRGEGAQK